MDMKDPVTDKMEQVDVKQTKNYTGLVGAGFVLFGILSFLFLTELLGWFLLLVGVLFLMVAAVQYLGYKAGVK